MANIDLNAHNVCENEEKLAHRNTKTQSFFVFNRTNSVFSCLCAPNKYFCIIVTLRF